MTEGGCGNVLSGCGKVSMAAVYPRLRSVCCQQGFAVTAGVCEAVEDRLSDPENLLHLRFTLTSSGYCVRPERGRMLSPSGPRSPHPEMGFL